jgi:hypothetical protein
MSWYSGDAPLAEYNAVVEARDRARATIAALEKRIAELEAELEQEERESEHFMRLTFIDAGANPAITWKERCSELEQSLTAERQRRESAETAEGGADRSA